MPRFLFFFVHFKHENGLYCTTVEQAFSFSIADLMVTDHHMPPYSEGELVRYIRSKERLDGIALIIYIIVLQETKSLLCCVMMLIV